MAFLIDPMKFANAARSRAGVGQIGPVATAPGTLLNQPAPKPVAPAPVAPVSAPAPQAPPPPAAPQFTADQINAAKNNIVRINDPTPVSRPATEFSPQRNLIAQQIAPASSGPNSFDQQSADYLRNAKVDDYSGQTQEARNMILEQLKSLQNAPDRFALAQSNYDQFQKDSEPAFQQQLRGVGQKAAALGRIGAGMTTNDLTGALGQHQNLLSGERTRGINQALENTLSDRLNIQNALQGAGGLLGGQDLSLNQSRANLALGQGTGFGNLGQNQAQREQAAVTAQQQQQRYQADLDQQNIQNQLSQIQEQRAAQAQGFNQQYLQQQMLMDAARQQNTAFPNYNPYGGQSSAQYGAGSINSAPLGYTG